jgi:hypothetical protein
MASTLNAMLGCIRALSEAEAHIRATAYDFQGGEREHHLQAANKARSALDALRASYAAPATSEQST